MQRRICAFCFFFHVLKYYKLKGIKNETAIECNKCVIVNMLYLFIFSYTLNMSVDIYSLKD